MTSTTSLDELMTNAQDVLKQQQESSEAARQQERRQKEQTAAEALDTALLPLLTQAFLDAVGPLRFYHSYDGYTTSMLTSAYFYFMGHFWHIRHVPGSYNTKPSWKVLAKEPKTNVASATTMVEKADDANLQVLLLDAMATFKAKREKAASDQAEWEAQQAKDIAERERQEAERERKRTEDRVRIEAVHETLQAELDAFVAKNRAAMWQWPEGFILKLNHYTYFTGGFRSEDGEDIFDYASGWTINPIDSEGFLTFEGTYNYGDSVRANRVVQLQAGHLPVREIRFFDSIASLPGELHREVSVTLEGIIWQSQSYGEEKKLMHASNEMHHRYATESIGEQPIGWIRELINDQVRAAQQAEQ